MEHPVHQTGGIRNTIRSLIRPVQTPIHEVLPRAVTCVLAQERPYHPSSPWFTATKAERKTAGSDTRFCNVWLTVPDRRIQHHAQPFFSEYGFQSFPEYASVLRFAPRGARPGHQNQEVMMMAHQRGGDYANMRIRQYLPKRRILLARTRFAHVPLRGPCPQGRRHQEPPSKPTDATNPTAGDRSSGSTTIAGPWLHGPAATEVRPLESATYFARPA